MEIMFKVIYVLNLLGHLSSGLHTEIMKDALVLISHTIKVCILQVMELKEIMMDT